MKKTLEKLISKEYLTASEAEKCLIEITEGKHHDILVSSFLTTFLIALDVFFIRLFQPDLE